MMKSIVSICVQAENSAKSFKKGKTKTGGAIDDEVVFVYDKEIKIESESDLELVKNIAK